MNPFFNPMGGFGMGNPSLFANPQAQAEMKRLMEESIYEAQLRELELMGFKDKARNL